MMIYLNIMIFYIFAMKTTFYFYFATFHLNEQMVGKVQLFPTVLSSKGILFLKKSFSLLFKGNSGKKIESLNSSLTCFV